MIRKTKKKELNRTNKSKYMTTKVEWLNIRLYKAEKKINYIERYETLYRLEQRQKEKLRKTDLKIEQREQVQHTITKDSRKRLERE